MKKETKRVVIVGSGVSGLSVAYYLKKERKDLEVLVLEKNGRCGGNIITDQVDGFTVEGGPDCFITEKPWALKLCQETGLGDRLIGTNDDKRNVFILWKGKLHTLPEGFMLLVPTSFLPFILSGLISPLGKLRVSLDLIIPRKRSDEEESLADFVRRRLGNEILEKIAEPLVAGIHAGSPETMSLKSTFPRFIELEQQYGSLILGMYQRMRSYNKAAAASAKSGDKPKYTMFMTLKEGMGGMIETLRSQVGEASIILGQSVVKITKAALEGSGQTNYQVHMDGENAIQAQAVVLATPAFVTSTILGGMDKELSEQLLTIPYISTATISLAYQSSQLSHPLNGFGFVIPRKEQRKIMASTWSSVKFPNRAPEEKTLIRCFVGGVNSENLVSMDDNGLETMVKNELRDIMGVKAEPLFTRIYRWEKSMPQYIVGHEAKISGIEAKVGKYPGLFLAGSAYNGIGISDCVRYAKEIAKQVGDFISPGDQTTS